LNSDLHKVKREHAPDHPDCQSKRLVTSELAKQALLVHFHEQDVRREGDKTPPKGEMNWLDSPLRHQILRYSLLHRIAHLRRISDDENFDDRPVLGFLRWQEFFNFFFVARRRV